MEGYNLPPMHQRESEWADFGVPPDPPPEAPAALKERYALVLFEKWKNTARRTVPQLELQHAVLREGGKLRSEWARRLFARAACWCRSRGRPGRLNQDDFLTLLTRLLRVLPQDELEGVAARLGTRAQPARELDEATRVTQGDTSADFWRRAVLTVAPLFRKWDRGFDASIELPRLQRATKALAQARFAGEDCDVVWRRTYAEWGQRAEAWKHPTDPKWSDAPAVDERAEMESCCGESQTFSIGYWRRNIPPSYAKTFIFSVLHEILPDGDGQGPDAWARTEQALNELDAHYVRLMRADARAKRPLRRPGTAPPGGRKQMEWHTTSGRESVDFEGRLTHLQCAECGRCMLRVDPQGDMPAWADKDDTSNPLPCAGCGRAHLQWHPVSSATAIGLLRQARLFETLAAAVNVETREQSREKHIAFQRDGDEGPRKGRPHTAPRSGRLQTGGAAGRRRSAGKDAPVMNECRRCGRRMLNMTSDGAPLQTPIGPGGAPCALTCPGCGDHHTEWVPVPAFDRGGTHCAMRSAALNAKALGRLSEEFNRQDRAGLGEITLRETARLFYNFCPSIPLVEAERLAAAAFEMWDRHKTARISFDELGAFVQRTITGAHAPWGGFSRKPGIPQLRDGDPTPEELEARRRAEAEQAAAEAERKRQAELERAPVMQRCRECGRHTLNLAPDGAAFEPPPGVKGAAPKLACAACGCTEWDPTPAFLPGKGHVELERLRRLGNDQPWKDMDKSPVPEWRPMLSLVPTPPAEARSR
eukprot:TRINITY_DN9861_c0_g1_i1.p1 TRINITY_DN9861_c0_g1~~TRINITY_DN9861_c0_g1_i1.p1  ORF type:complete len:761 (+),score=184.86 TRINITY_DN9861_c0_g1_i1:95-2377(+)